MDSHPAVVLCGISHLATAVRLRTRTRWSLLKTTLNQQKLPREAGLASPDAFPGIATWHVLRQPCVPARSLPALRPLMLLSAVRLILERFFIPAKRALRPGVVFASLASRHDPLPALRPLMLLSAMRLILERCFIPAKRALRPGMFFAGIASADVLRRTLPRASEHHFLRQQHHFPPKVASLPDEVGLATRHVLRQP